MKPSRDAQLEALKPAGRPADRDQYAWERYRHYLMARAMIADDLTPIEAAERVDGTLAGDYPFAIARRARSKGEHPGGMKPSERQTWVLMTRVESPDEPLIAAVTVQGEAVPVPEEFRFDAGILQRAAEVYDYDFRRGKVILGYGGPTHREGRYQRPVAMIRSVEFDGYALWGLLEDDGFELAFAVGFQNAFDRSILLSPTEVGLYVEHLALMLGEQPVQPNLPDLSQNFPPALAAGEDTVAISRATGWSRAIRLEEPMEKNEPKPDGIAAKARALLDNALSLARSVGVEDAPKPEPSTDPPIQAQPEPKPEPKPAVDDGRLAALERAIGDTLTAVGQLAAAVQTKASAEAEAAKRAAVAFVDEQLADLSRSMRLTPAAAKGWRERLVINDEAIVGARGILAELAKADPVQAPLGRTVIPADNPEGEPVEITFDPNEFRSPTSGGASTHKLELLARARHAAREEAGDDPEKYRVAFNRIAGDLYRRQLSA